MDSRLVVVEHRPTPHTFVPSTRPGACRLACGETGLRCARCGLCQVCHEGRPSPPASPGGPCGLYEGPGRCARCGLREGDHPPPPQPSSEGKT